MSETQQPAHPRRHKIIRRIVLCALIIIPVFQAGMMVWSSIDPMHRLNDVPAAIVNEDRAVVVDQGSSDPSTVHLGDDLTNSLVTSTDDQNFHWTTTDATDAANGLDDGTYLAVLTIPRDFSANATSIATDDGLKAVQATLSLATNDAANYIAGTAGKSIGQAATDDVAKQLRAQYLDQMYLSLTDLHTTLGDAAKNTKTLADGVRDAHDGASDLSKGMDELASKASALPTGVGQLATGSSQVTKGAQSLAAGTRTLAGKAKDLAAGAKSAQTGASALSKGVSALASGSGSVGDGLTKLSTSMGTLDQGSNAVASGLSQLAQRYDVMTDAQRKAALATLASRSAAVGQGMTQADTAAGKLNDGFTAGAAKLKAGADQLAGPQGLGQLATGAAAFQKGVVSLDTGAAKVSAGAKQVSDGLAQLNGQLPALTTGISSAAGGARSLASGLSDASSGAKKLADGLKSGASSVPHYTDAQATALSDVVSDPVSLDATHLNAIPSFGYALSSYFMPIALWVGSISIFFAHKALSKRLLATSLPVVLVAVRSFLIPAAFATVQAIAVVSVVRFFVGIDPACLLGVYAMAIASSATFVAINQAATALLGPAGRFFVLLFLVLQITSAGGTYPLQTSPGLFQAFHHIVPMGYAVQGFRSLIAGGSLGVGQAFVAFGCWTVGCLLLTTLAAHQARKRGVRELIEDVHI